MTEKPAPEQPLHIRQAEGLRQLADAIEANPGLSPHMVFPLGRMDGYLVDDDEEPRAELRAFHTAMTAAGADVVIENGDAKCVVRAKFSGAVVVTLSATAARMADQRPNPISYEPLVVED